MTRTWQNIIEPRTWQPGRESAYSHCSLRKKQRNLPSAAILLQIEIADTPSLETFFLIVPAKTKVHLRITASFGKGRQQRAFLVAASGVMMCVQRWTPARPSWPSTRAHANPLRPELGILSIYLRTPLFSHAHSIPLCAVLFTETCSAQVRWRLRDGCKAARAYCSGRL